MKERLIYCAPEIATFLFLSECGFADSLNYGEEGGAGADSGSNDLGSF